MMGRKRKQSTGKSSSKKQKSKVNFKSKSYDKRIKDFNENDEEIVGSESSDGENKKGNDDFFNYEDDEENNDEKRLRMAKNLISKIDEENDNDDPNYKDTDNLILEKIKEERNEYVLDCTSSLSPTEVYFSKGHLASITCLEITKDSKKVITGAKDCRAIKWDIETGKKVLFPSFMSKPILASALTNDSKYAFFAGKEKFIHQVDINNEKLVHSFKAHNDAITGIKFDPINEQFYTISKDLTLKVWALGNLKNPVFLETFWGHTSRICDIDMITSNRLVTCGFDKQVNLWKVDVQSFLQFKSPDSYSVDNIVSLSTDNFVTSSYEGNLFLWNIKKKKPIFKINNAHGFSKSFDFNERCGLTGTDSFSEEKLYKKEKIDVPYPVLSLGTVKNSDLVFSGSHNGLINFYQLSKEKKNLQMFKQFKTRLGCINIMKIDKANDFMVIGYGKDSRLGRWETETKAKIGISIIKLFHEQE